LQALSIDGTESGSVSWQTSTYNFSDGDSATGYVKFLAGFDIPIDAYVTFDISKSISGPVDLNDFGSIILNGPVTLAPNSILSQGGNIEGRGHTIILESDTTIPEGKQLHITSTTAIDGMGNTLYLEPHACLVVDNSVTLTLKNMRVKNTRNNLCNPIIRPTGHRAQIALQNVELALADDFIFREGQLFIHDDVIITGTSVFSYRSTQQSYICDASTFGFDKRTIFFYYPSSVDNNLIQMQSETSTLYLDGATLLTTHTGMRLSTGMLCLDNNVTLSTVAQTLLTNLTGVVSKEEDQSVSTVKWSPDGKYLAVGTLYNPTPGDPVIGKTHELQMYRFDTAITPTLVGIASKKIRQRVYSIDWRPDGKYLALGTHNTTIPGDPEIPAGNEVQVYRFDATVTPTLIGVASKEQGVSASIPVAWSPNGNYLAIGTWIDPIPGDPEIVTGHELQVYSFDPISTSTLIGIASKDMGLTSTVLSIEWHPNGQYIAVGTSVEPVPGEPGKNIAKHSELQIYRFDATVTPTLIGITGRDQGDDSFDDVRYVSWSPDGKYLAVTVSGNPDTTHEGVSVGDELRVYRFDGSTLIGVDSLDLGLFQRLTWSPDGSYVAGTRNLTNIGSGKELFICRFDGTSLYEITEASKELGATAVGISWRADGKYIAIGTVVESTTIHDSIPAGHELRVYEVGYRFDTTPQGFSNGIIFGDPSQPGGVGGLDVHVLANAHVEIAGYVTESN